MVQQLPTVTIIYFALLLCTCAPDACTPYLTAYLHAVPCYQGLYAQHTIYPVRSLSFESLSKLLDSANDLPKEVVLYAIHGPACKQTHSAFCKTNCLVDALIYACSAVCPVLLCLLPTLSACHDCAACLQSFTNAHVRDRALPASLQTCWKIKVLMLMLEL